MKEIKKIAEKAPFWLARTGFFIFLSFLFIQFLTGILIYYRYGFPTGRPIEDKSLKRSEFEQAVSRLEKRARTREGLGDKSYPDPFD